MTSSASDVAVGLRSSASHLLVDATSFDALVLDDDVEHHLRRVLRLRDGAAVTVTDGAGRWRPAVVVGGGRGAGGGRAGGGLGLEPSGAIASTERREPALTVATAIPKGDRIDWMVQKATEIGVDRIVLLEAERSVVRWPDDRVERNLARLSRVADEATRQSRRVWRTTIDGPVAASEAIAGRPIAEPGGRAMRADDRWFAVGPEGGWSESELADAGDHVSLGPHVLRVETAVLVGVARCVV